VAPEKLRDGLRLSLATELRRNPIDALSPAWKTGNYLNNILCLREARARGADEVVILNQAGEVTEAAVSNIAFVKDGAVITPPLTAGILGGITRELVLTKIAPLVGVPVREQTVRPADFAGMQECFLLSTTRDVAPVAAIDETRFKVGGGTVAARLKAAFADYARAEAKAHPELCV
jgi:branched-subunit amino acid aminotransferase/4-amino-4-deoxychorismate lyase